MIKHHIFINIGIWVLFFLPKIAIANLSEETKISHNISFIHPGISTTDSISKVLVELRNEKGQISEFYMDVETVVCGDNQCRIDTIRIFWDRFGFYNRLVLPLEVQLEKAEGQHFTEVDYEKLDQILSNKKSGLKDVYKWDIVGTEASEGVDAISGATISLNTVDYVKGAVWTCFTLWHWANGEVFSIIRKITGRSLDQEELKNLLNHQEIISKKFAIEALSNRQEYDPTMLQLVLKQAHFDDYELQKLIINYLENGDELIYQNSIEQLIKKGNKTYQLFYLNQLYHSRKTLSTSLFESIIDTVLSSNNYLIINQYLNILEEKKIITPFIISQMISTLSHENFIITRRVYWFLRKGILSEDQREKLDIFQRENGHRL